MYAIDPIQSAGLASSTTASQRLRPAAATGRTHAAWR